MKPDSIMYLEWSVEDPTPEQLERDRQALLLRIATLQPLAAEAAAALRCALPFKGTAFPYHRLLDVMGRYRLNHAYGLVRDLCAKLKKDWKITGTVDIYHDHAAVGMEFGQPAMMAINDLGAAAGDMLRMFESQRWRIGKQLPVLNPVPLTTIDSAALVLAKALNTTRECSQPAQPNLTDGESEILAVVRSAPSALSGKQIASKTGLSHETVRSYLRPKATLRKINLITRTKNGYIATHQ